MTDRGEHGEGGHDERDVAMPPDRNARYAKVDWRFTTADARIKPKRLYPRFE